MLVAMTPTTPRLFLVVYLLCYVYTVLSQSPEDDGLSEELRQCALAPALNTSHDVDIYSQLEMSLCRSYDYSACMEYENTVFVQTEGISHTYATSTIRVEINPNATVGQEEFYYAFCVSYNTSLDYALIACASNDGEGLEIQHRWEKNGYAKVRVGVFPKASYKNLIGCNTTQGTRVAGNFGLEVGMKVYNDQQPFNALPERTPPHLHSSTPPNNTYLIGNLTFVPQPDLTMVNESVELYSYSYSYDYGDNSTVEEHSQFNTTHLYENAGNYSYTVEAFAFDSMDNSVGFYTTHNGTIVVLQPVSNVSLRFNANNNSITEDTKVHLHICANGSFPIRVCWVIQPTNASLPLKSSSDFKCNVSHIYTCHTVFSICSSYEMSFSEKGRYKVDAKFINRVSCVNASYTFQVVAASKPPIVATTTSAGVVVAIIIAVVVILIILAVGGYLPYRRYRNQMIETADFRFIDLTEKKQSTWHRFRLKITTMYTHLRSRGSTDKIGLVNLISESQNPHGSLSSSSSSLASCNNNNYSTI